MSDNVVGIMAKSEDKKKALEAAKGSSASNRRRMSYPGMLISKASSADGSKLGESSLAHCCLLLSLARKGSS